jgi:hypothetical protein
MARRAILAAMKYRLCGSGFQPRSSRQDAAPTVKRPTALEDIHWTHPSTVLVRTDGAVEILTQRGPVIGFGSGNSLKGGRWKLAHGRVEGNAAAYVCVTKKKIAHGDGQSAIAMRRVRF